MRLETLAGYFVYLTMLSASVMETHGNSIQNTDKPLSSSFTQLFFSFEIGNNKLNKNTEMLSFCTLISVFCFH